MGDVKNAVQNLAFAATLDPTNLELQMALAGVYDKIGAHEEATRILGKVVDLAPNEIAPLITLGKQLISNDELDSAEIVFKKATDLEPSNSFTWNGLAEVQSSMGLREESAKALLNSVIKGKPLMSSVRALSQLPKELVSVDLNKLMATVEKNSRNNTLSYKLSRDFTKANIMIHHGKFKDGFKLLHSANQLQFKKIQVEYKKIKLCKSGLGVL